MLHAGLGTPMILNNKDTFEILLKQSKLPALNNLSF